MIFELKDLVYIAMTLLSVGGVFATMKYRVEKLETTTATLHGAVFQKDGGFNLVDNSTCKDRRNVINTTIRRDAETAQRNYDELRCLNQNVIKIMIHMKLDPIETKRGQ